MADLFVQLTVIACFVGVIVVLFFERKDYLSFTVLFMLVAALVSAIFIPEARDLDVYIDAIEWEVIFFFIPMFIIVVILEPVFEELAIRLIHFQGMKDLRKFFYVICLITTMSAGFLTATSTVLIFVPIVVKICTKLKVNPAPFMLGISICINLAATLTPFGTAQNILIYTHFDKDAAWFFATFLPYFAITFVVTIVLLDIFVVRKLARLKWDGYCEDKVTFEQAIHDEESTVPRMDPKKFKVNIIALAVFFIMLLLIPAIYIVALIGLVLFIFINPVEHKKGEERVDLAHYAAKVDYKLIYFFICLFIMAFLMELNGSLLYLESAISNLAEQNLLVLAITIMVVTSLISGLLDNAPVTILFLPIVDDLIFATAGPQAETILLVAFVLGINLGSNFLPQGSAADMLNLELAKKYCVHDMNFKRLTKVGASFAVLHVVIGIFYLQLLMAIL